MPIPVILNPAARSTKAASLEHALRRLSPEPELHLTKGPADATAIAEALAEITNWSWPLAGTAP